MLNIPQVALKGSLGWEPLLPTLSSKMPYGWRIYSTALPFIPLPCIQDKSSQHSMSGTSCYCLWNCDLISWTWCNEASPGVFSNPRNIGRIWLRRMSPCARGLSFTQFFATLWTEACKAPLCMGFPGWVAISSSGGFSRPRIEPPFSAVAGRFFIAEPLEKPIKEDNWCQFKRVMGRVAECSSSHMVHIVHGDWKPIRIEFPGNARGHGVLRRLSAKGQPPVHPFNNGNGVAPLR